MKFKNIATIAVIILICVIGYNMINDSGTGIEKDLIATLPEAITVCYCIDNNGEKIMNNLEVKNLTIDTQTTDRNYKTADCTIEMEGNDIKMTAYVTLGIRDQLQEDYSDDQMSMKEYIDPFTGEPVQGGK